MENSQFFKRYEENARGKQFLVSLWYLFYSPRIHTELSNPVAAVLESCLIILSLPAPHQLVALVLIQPYTCYSFYCIFVTKKESNVALKENAKNVQLKSIKIMKFGAMPGI